MVSAIMIRRLKQAEAFTGGGGLKPACIFVAVEDTSIPDPDGMLDAEPFAGPQDIIGVVGHGRHGRRVRVARLAGESVNELEERAQVLVPNIILFFFAYGSLSWSRENFETVPEAGTPPQ